MMRILTFVRFRIIYPVSGRIAVARFFQGISPKYCT